MQVQDGLAAVSKTLVPRLEAAGVSYSVHILTHSTDTRGIAAAIASKASELEAHCIVLGHQRKSAITVQAAP